jgi:hypothetical protein
VAVASALARFIARLAATLITSGLQPYLRVFLYYCFIIFTNATPKRRFMSAQTATIRRSGSNSHSLNGTIHHPQTFR